LILIGVTTEKKKGGVIVGRHNKNKRIRAFSLGYFLTLSRSIGPHSLIFIVILLFKNINVTRQSPLPLRQRLHNY
jgi:hypothetical protein